MGPRRFIGERAASARGAAATALCLFAFASPALAQEIVVTAERRAQETNTLAGNAASLTAADLEAIGAQHPAEALNRLPGVAIHRNNGVENLPAIRSPVLIGGQSAGSFLLLEDGVPIRAAGFSNVNSLFETSMDFAARVEVVRGPGSALYGSNAVHGLVNVITSTAGRTSLNGAPLSYELTAGSFGRVSATGAARFGSYYAEEACPPSTAESIYLHCRSLTPHRGFLGLHAEHVDGWRDDADLSRQHALLGWDADFGPWLLESRLVLQNLNQQSAGFIIGANTYDVGAIARSNPTPGAYRDQRLARGRATLSREMGDWRVAFTGHARWIDSALQLFFFPSRAREETGQTGGGLQAAAYWDPSETLSLIFGADLDQTRGSLREEQFLPNQPNNFLQGLHYDYEVDMRQAALYAQARWRFAPGWSVTAGLRGEQVRYEYDNQIAGPQDFGRFRRAPDRTDEFESVTPKLGFVWRPSEDQSIWLNLARGARAPQITDLYSLQIQQTPGQQEEETLDSVELGWRGDLGPARIEAALYHMEKEGTSFRASNGQTVTGGSSEHRGVEVSGIVPIGERFDLAGWVTYAEHTYTFDAAVDGIVSGNDIDTAPRWIGNARAIWRPADTVRLELEWVYMGEYFTDAANAHVYPGHDVFNLRADWDVSAGVTLFGTVRNLTNTDYAERADFAFGNDRYFPGEDRAFTIGVRARR